MFDVLSSKEKPAGQLLGRLFVVKSTWGNQWKPERLRDATRQRTEPDEECTHGALSWERKDNWDRWHAEETGRDNVNMGEKEFKQFCCMV